MVKKPVAKKRTKSQVQQVQSEGSDSEESNDKSVDSKSYKHLSTSDRAAILQNQNYSSDDDSSGSKTIARAAPAKMTSSSHDKTGTKMARKKVMATGPTPMEPTAAGADNTLLAANAIICSGHDTFELGVCFEEEGRAAYVGPSGEWENTKCGGVCKKKLVPGKPVKPDDETEMSRKKPMYCCTRCKVFVYCHGCFTKGVLELANKGGPGVTARATRSRK